MNHPVKKSTILSYIICMICFSFAASINYSVIEYYFNSKDFSGSISYMNHSRMIGVVVGVVLLLFFYNFFEAKKILATSALMYMISQVNLILVMEVENVKLHYFFLSVSGVAIVFQLIALFVVKTKLNDHISISLYFMSALLGYIFSEAVLHFFLYEDSHPHLRMLIGYNMLPIAFIILVVVFDDNFKFGKVTEPSNYSTVIKYIELESLVGFTIFYVLMVLLDGFDIYSQVDSLFYIVTGKANYFMAIFLLIAVYPINKLIKSYNHHKTIIFSLALMFVLIIFMPFWNLFEIPSFIFWWIIATQLYQLFVSSIMNIVDKFYEEDQFGAMLIYFLMCSAGFFSGYLTINNLEQSLGDYALHYSLSALLFISLSYYGFRFKKDKLYER